MSNVIYCDLTDRPMNSSGCGTLLWLLRKIVTNVEMYMVGVGYIVCLDESMDVV